MKMQLKNSLKNRLKFLTRIIFATDSDNFQQRPRKTEGLSESKGSLKIFIPQFLRYLSLSALFILLGLLIGIIGYHWTAKLSWVDALVEASMILSGMGPITNLSSTMAKVFASLYALFSGLIFVLAMGVVLSPVVYTLLKQLHVKVKD
jgi:hypothetical protein